MCELCGKWACPPNCPNYLSETERHCIACGSRLYEGETCYEMNGKPYCESCILGASLEELVRICEADDCEELLLKLGLTRGFSSRKEYYGG